MPAGIASGLGHHQALYSYSPQGMSKEESERYNELMKRLVDIDKAIEETRVNQGKAGTDRLSVITKLRADLAQAAALAATGRAQAYGRYFDQLGPLMKKLQDYALYAPDDKATASFQGQVGGLTAASIQKFAPGDPAYPKMEKEISRKLAAGDTAGASALLANAIQANVNAPFKNAVQSSIGTIEDPASAVGTWESMVSTANGQIAQVADTVGRQLGLPPEAIAAAANTAQADFQRVTSDMLTSDQRSLAEKRQQYGAQELPREMVEMRQLASSIGSADPEIASRVMALYDAYQAGGGTMAGFYKELGNIPPSPYMVETRKRIIGDLDAMQTAATTDPFYAGVANVAKQVPEFPAWMEAMNFRGDHAVARAAMYAASHPGEIQWWANYLQMNPEVKDDPAQARIDMRREGRRQGGGFYVRPVGRLFELGGRGQAGTSPVEGQGTGGPNDTFGQGLPEEPSVNFQRPSPGAIEVSGPETFAWAPGGPGTEIPGGAGGGGQRGPVGQAPAGRPVAQPQMAPTGSSTGLPMSLPLGLGAERQQAPLDSTGNPMFQTGYPGAEPPQEPSPQQAAYPPVVQAPPSGYPPVQGPPPMTPESLSLVQQWFNRRPVPGQYPG